MIEISNIAFMDFEASATRDGFPVEVGWAWVEGNTVHSAAMLIAPADEWLTPAFSWDPIAQAIHGLSVQNLQEGGLPVGQVCRTLNHQLLERVIVFDTGPDGADRHWMDILFSETGETRLFKLGGPAGEILKAIADGHGISGEVQSEIKSLAPPMTHQAAMDAAHYAWRAAAFALLSVQSVEVSALPDRIELQRGGFR